MSTTKNPTTTCPPWCTLSEHDWHLNTLLKGGHLGRERLERDHATVLLTSDEVSAEIVGVECVNLSDGEAFRREHGEPSLSLAIAPQGAELDAGQLRELITALEQGLEILEGHALAGSEYVEAVEDLPSVAMYDTRDAAISEEILPALGEHFAEFDVEGIADEVLASGSDAHGRYRYWQRATAEEFWEIVARHALDAS